MYDVVMLIVSAVTVFVMWVVLWGIVKDVCYGRYEKKAGKGQGS